MNHIALLLPTLNRIGGAERQVVTLAQELAARGWRVTLIALSGTAGEFGELLHSAGVTFLSLEMRKGLVDPRGWVRLNVWLRRKRPDLLHAHLPHAAWLARWSRLAAPVRVVMDTIHTAGTGTGGRKLGYLWSNWLTNKTTAVSHGAAHTWLDARMVTDEHLEVVPNGIDTETWKPDLAARMALRAELGLRDEFLWLAAGRLEPVKNFPLLLRVMASLPPHAHMVIAGSGSQAEVLWSQARALGIEGRIRFPGYQSNLLRWMQAADGFALSSLWEGLPMSLLEAGACGLPCVSTAVAGATEILLDQLTGFLVPAADEDTLRQAMLRLMEMSAESRQSMGLAARQSITERYSIGSVLNRWESLYANLLADHPIPSRVAARILRKARPAPMTAGSETAASPNGASLDAS
jgi:glycosyltransferase involved in cell wall biosynthesis